MIRDVLLPSFYAEHGETIRGIFHGRRHDIYGGIFRYPNNFFISYYTGENLTFSIGNRFESGIVVIGIQKVLEKIGLDDIVGWNLTIHKKSDSFNVNGEDALCIIKDEEKKGKIKVESRQIHKKRLEF